MILFVTAALFATCTGAKDQAVTRLIDETLSNEIADQADWARYYKETPTEKLEMHFFFPQGYDSTRPEPYPVSTSFCGGAWVIGEMSWAQGNARFMSELGFVGVAVEYRYADRENISVLDAMKDANSSIRWLRMHAEEYNLDPTKVIAMGDSAGGHLALSTAFFPQYIESTEDPEISSVPNRIFTVAAAVNVNDEYFQSLLIGEERAENCSPYQNVRPGLPPITMIQCVKDDKLPFHYTEEFIEMLLAAGNQAELYPVPEGSHQATWEDPSIVSQWQNSFRKVVADLSWNL